MIETHEFATESQARAFWHHLGAQMGFDRFVKQCSACLIAGVYTIKINRE